MKLATLFYFCIIVMTVPCYAAKQNAANNMPIACIEAILPNGQRNVGMGFIVAPGVIATVQHQIKDAKKIRVHFGSNTENAETIRQENGLALLQITNQSSQELALDNNLPRKGTKVFTYHCQSDKNHIPIPVKSEMGTITEPQRLGDNNGNSSLIEAELSIQKGNSGGPLLGEDYNVIGVINGYDGLKNNLSVSIPVTTLIQLIVKEKNIRFKELLLVQGEKYYKQKDFYHAQKRFELAITLQPDYYDAYTYLANTFFALGNFTAARDTLHKAIAIDLQNPNAYSFLAAVSNKLSDPVSERNALQCYLELEKDAKAVQNAEKMLKTIEKNLFSKNQR